MKKFIYMSVLVLMAALTLTSCGSDDDEPAGGKSVNYDAVASFSQDVIDICDVTISYKDGEGKTVTEAVKSTSWSKKVAVKKLPTSVGVKFDFKMKPNIELNKDKYDLIVKIQHDVLVDGKSKGETYPITVTESYGARVANVANIITSKSGTIHGYDISSAGVVSKTQKVDF